MVSVTVYGECCVAKVLLESLRGLFDSPRPSRPGEEENRVLNSL